MAHSNGRHPLRSLYISTRKKNKFMSIFDEEVSFNSAVKTAMDYYYETHVEEVIRKRKRMEEADKEMQERLKRSEERRERDVAMMREHERRVGFS